MDRRSYLGRLAVMAAPLVAGCAAGDPTTKTASPTETPTPAPTATATPTETPTDGPTPTDSPTPTDTGGATVSATGQNVFSPERVSIEPGETVTWKNTASGTYDSHTVTSAQFHEKAKQWSMDARFSGGETLSHTFDSAGIYEYYCEIHGKNQMCGVVLVGDVTLEATLPCE